MLNKIINFPFLVLLGLILLGFSGCAKEGVHTVSDDSPNVCIADSTKKLRIISTLPTCPESDVNCRVKCEAGNPEYCVARAYAIERNPTFKKEAPKLYRKACEDGLAIACTNFAASVWAREHSEEEAVCVKEIFTKSCKASEPFACGMAGRVMVDRAKTKADFDSAKIFLESKCESYGHFSCRVLAKAYEDGDFGPFEASQIKDLLKKACDGGDPDACGNPKTVSETFH